MKNFTILATTLLGLAAALLPGVRAGAEEEFRMRLGENPKITLPPLPPFPRPNTSRTKETLSAEVINVIFVRQYSERLSKDIAHLRAGRDPGDAGFQEQRYRRCCEKTASLLRRKLKDLRELLPRVSVEKEYFRRNATEAAEAGEKVMIEWDQLPPEIRSRETIPPASENR